MGAALHVLPLRFCRGVVALVFVTSTATVVLAVAQDKAMYVGGTIRDFRKAASGRRSNPTSLVPR
jgi:hypothetical protein